MSTLDEAQGGGHGSLLVYRVGEIAKTVASLVKWRGEVDLERQRLRDNAVNLAEEMNELKQAVDTLRKTILGFSITVAVSALGFAVTVVLTGGHP